MEGEIDGFGGDFTYGLVEKFVVVSSAGGPYEDDSFVAGCYYGSIEQQLKTADSIGSPTLSFVTIPTELRTQVDLMAMRLGWKLVDNHEDEPVEGWSIVSMHKVATVVE